MTGPNTPPYLGKTIAAATESGTVLSHHAPCQVFCHSLQGVSATTLTLHSIQLGSAIVPFPKCKSDALVILNPPMSGPCSIFYRCSLPSMSFLCGLHTPDYPRRPSHCVPLPRHSVLILCCWDNQIHLQVSAQMGRPQEPSLTLKTQWACLALSEVPNRAQSLRKGLSVLWRGNPGCLVRKCGRTGKERSQDKGHFQEGDPCVSWGSACWDPQETVQNTAQRGKRLFIHISYHWLRAAPWGITPQHIHPVPVQTPAARDHSSQRLMVLGATRACEQDVTWTMSPALPPPCSRVLHS